MSSVRFSWLFAAVTAIFWSLSNGVAMLPAMPGMFSRHMLSHIVLMNVAAPLLAAMLYSTGRVKFNPGVSALFAISSLQLVLLVAWHSAGAMTLVMAEPAMATLMQATLFASALCFWHLVYQQINTHIWRALAALLITGKLYCLMAALLVFAPRSLYPDHSATTAISLADQQLAGVMMVVACPLSYVLIATVLVARWMAALHRQSTSNPDWKLPAEPGWN